MSSVEAPLPCKQTRRNERTMLACGSPAVLSGGTSPPASLGSIRPMGNLGGGEMLVIFFVALIVLGPNKLPDAARQVGRAVNEIRRVSGGFQREMREAMNEPMRLAEEARNQVVDPFGQTSSSAKPEQPTTPTAGGTDPDPPLPSVPSSEAALPTDAPASEADEGAHQDPSSDHEASAPQDREPLTTTPIPAPPPPFSAVSSAPPEDETPAIGDTSSDGGGEPAEDD